MIDGEEIGRAFTDLIIDMDGSDLSLAKWHPGNGGADAMSASISQWRSAEGDGNGSNPIAAPTLSNSAVNLVDSVKVSDHSLRLLCCHWDRKFWSLLANPDWILGFVGAGDFGLGSLCFVFWSFGSGGFG